MTVTIKSRKEPGSEAVRFRKAGHRHYSVEISLNVQPHEAINDIKAVEYELHPTFKERYRHSSDSSNGFRIVIRTYGYFDIKARITKKDGTTVEAKGEVTF